MGRKHTRVTYCTMVQAGVSIGGSSTPDNPFRCYCDGMHGEILSYQLCGYCDASLTAYAAVIYLLIETEWGCHMKFVVAKTRVSPLKKQSIPRLELLSAVLLARLMDTARSSLISQLNISSCHCYSDSHVALCWIRNTGRSWKPFVQNRVSEIRKLFPVECWKHIPGIKNPADIPSRGTTPLELLVSKLWQNGPELPFEQEEQHIDIPSQCLEELQASEKQAVHGLLANGGVSSGVQNLLECKSFSKLSRLINTVTNVFRFCSILRRKKTVINMSCTMFL